MDNNNSIPYGSISWDNEDTISQASQQRESQRIPSARNLNTTDSNHNGLRYALRGPQFPPPQGRLEGVGLSRQMALANHRQQHLQTPHSNVQQPCSSSSASSNDIQYERFFSLRPVLNTPSTHLQTQSTSQPWNNNSSEGQSLTSSDRQTDRQTHRSYSNSLPGSAGSYNPGTAACSQSSSCLAAGFTNDNAYNNNNNIEIPQGQNDGRLVKEKGLYYNSQLVCTL